MMKDGISAIEYIDQIKQNRTGVTAYVTSVDENVLNKTASGTNMLQNAAMAKIELIARVFAETGVKRLMWLIHALSLKHARKAEVVRLRNQWVTVDPRSWKKRYDMTVSVGLGTGNRDQQMMHLGNILAIQEKLLPIGLVSKKNIRHAVSKYIQSAGFKDDESFLAPSPQAQPGQPDGEDQPIQMQPPPDPLAVEKVKGDYSLQQESISQQGETQRKAMELQANAEIEARKLHVDMAQSEADRQLEGQKVQAENERAKSQSEVDKYGHEVKSLGAPPNVLMQGHQQTTQMMHQGFQAIAQGQQQLAEMIAGLGKLLSAEKELVKDPKTGNKRVRLVQ
jgi:hypothetical protein